MTAFNILITKKVNESDPLKYLTSSQNSINKKYDNNYL